MNDWSRALTRHGFTVTDAGTFDPFRGMVEQGKDAHVGVSLQASADYGSIKCNVSVTLSCPQSEPHINLAGELAFRKALELVNDGASHIGAPTLPPWTEPT